MAEKDEATGGGTWALPPLRVIAAIGALIVVAVVTFVLILRFIESERERDILEWQKRLAIVADSRHAAVDDWLERQFGHLMHLAQNASLQLYVTELLAEDRDPAQPSDATAEASYLENLLVVTAERAGFTGRMTGARVDANVERTGVAGIALFDMQGRALVATSGFPPIEGPLADFLTGVQRGRRGLLDLHTGVAGTPTMGFTAPVFAVHGNQTAGDQLGVILGIKEVGPHLYPLLVQPGTVAETAEAVLVRKSGTVAEYLSPLKDGKPPLKLQLSLDTPDLAAAFALSTAGGFGLKKDYRNEAVLVAGRALAAAPWTMLYKVDTAEALADSESRLTRLSITLALIVAAVAFALIAAWRSGTSRRAQEAADRYMDLARKLDEQNRFLQLLTESQTNPIFIVDADGRYQFANSAAAEVAGIPAESMVGKSLESVLGPHNAKRHTKLTRDALEGGEHIVEVYHQQVGETELIFQAVHIPLPSTAGYEKAVLVIEENVTVAITERERRERILGQIVRVLVNLVDRRDPHAADHSERLARVATGIGGQMALNETEMETAEISAKLMNLGKFLVPREILTKTASLTDEEGVLLQKSMDQTPELLAGIEFDGPVAEIIHQARENWDGSGRPQGLEGEAIMPVARILSVANAFIAMTSSRAYRQGVSIEDALNRLMKDGGHRFERRSVAALVLFLENVIGKENWADFLSDLHKETGTA